MTFLKKIILIVTLFPFVLFALDMDDFEVGDMVYIDKWLIEDEKVKVLKKYYGSPNEVFVRRNNGDKEWVKLSELMGTTGKVIEDVGKEAISYLFNSMRESAKRGPSITIKNNCNHGIKVAIHYLSSYEDEWKTKYWYSVEAYEKSSLTARTNNKVIYLYITGGGSVWDGDDTYRYIDGEKRGMRKVEYTDVVLCGN